jgi:predicted NUDIX family NTP pyrophosphohydrolase
MTVSDDRSAGILLYHREGRTAAAADAGVTPGAAEAGGIRVFLGHMGGPFWAHKTSAAWSIPKGLIEPGEDPFGAALREFREEIGDDAPDVVYTALGDFRYTSGKTVTIYAGESDLVVDELHSTPVTVEWPRGSGRMLTFPEIDAVEWCDLELARTRLVRGQVPALAALEERIAAGRI